MTKFQTSHHHDGKWIAVAGSQFTTSMAKSISRHSWVKWGARAARAFKKIFGCNPNVCAVWLPPSTAPVIIRLRCIIRTFLIHASCGLQWWYRHLGIQARDSCSSTGWPVRSCIILCSHERRVKQTWQKRRRLGWVTFQDARSRNLPSVSYLMARLIIACQQKQHSNNTL